MITTRAGVSVERCLREHQDLSNRVESINSFLGHSRPETGSGDAHIWAVSLAHHILELHDRLVRHFRNEEMDASSETFLEEYPEAVQKIGELHRDHVEILAWCRDLMTATLIYSEGGSPDDPRLRARVTDLLERVGKHESAETSLLQSLVTDDLGDGG